MKRVLIVDDDVAVTNYFMVFLMQTERYEPTVVNDSREVEPLLEREKFDAVMLDLDMPDVSGMEILRMINSKALTVPVIVLTGVNDVDLAVKSMKLGAFDYLTKPVDEDHLTDVLDNAIEHAAINDRLKELPGEITADALVENEAFSHLPTENPEMIRLFLRAERVAMGDLSVFIWGNRGTGRERLARGIHRASPRRNGPFIAVDSASHRKGKFASELFGRDRDWGGKHEEKQGFIESAAGGTLFIDNIDCLSLPVQIRLKRVIQNSEFYRDNSTEIKKSDVRIMVSSTCDLTGSVYRETFSRDLLYHLMINSIRIPSLKARPGDIPILAHHFLRQALAKLNREDEKVTFSEEFMALLMQYSYPDNIQELKNIISCAVVGTEPGEITPDSISLYLREKMTSGVVDEDFTPVKLNYVVADHISKTLEYCNGNTKQAAYLLGISESDVQDQIDNY